MMKTAIFLRTVTMAVFIFISISITAQDKSEQVAAEDPTSLKTYIIERNIPDAGAFSMADLKGISQKSCQVLDGMGSDRIQWLHSYVAGDKIYCLYKAESVEAIKEHAEKGGFPANAITEVANIINPETATVTIE
jgi:hypothetical protein